MVEIWTLRDSFQCQGKAISSVGFSTSKLIIETFNPTSLNTWFLAGYCQAIYNVIDVGETVSRWEKLALNKKQLIDFDSISEYKILIELKPWISVANIKIWEFV